MADRMVGAMRKMTGTASGVGVGVGAPLRAVATNVDSGIGYTARVIASSVHRVYARQKAAVQRRKLVPLGRVVTEVVDLFIEAVGRRDADLRRRTQVGADIHIV